MRTRERFILFLAATGLLACNGIQIGGRKDPRDPVSLASGSSSALYRTEIWSAHKQYEFGEPVHLRATLTNQSKKELKAELETYPIINIAVRYPAPRTDFDGERVWSQEHPDEVRHALTLAAGESYVIEWTFTLAERGQYIAGICSSGDAGGLTSRNRSCAPHVDIYYGIEEPTYPMP